MTLSLRSFVQLAPGFFILTWYDKVGPPDQLWGILCCLTFKVILKDLCRSKPQGTHERTYGSETDNNFAMKGAYMGL